MADYEIVDQKLLEFLTRIVQRRHIDIRGQAQEWAELRAMEERDRACELDGLLSEGFAKVLFGLRVARTMEPSASDDLWQREGVPIEEIYVPVGERRDTGELRRIEGRF
ncbi:MAG: hypothetical protein AAF160_20820 [Pseudomonadota bacterium]